MNFLQLLYTSQFYQHLPLKLLSNNIASVSIGPINWTSIKRKISIIHHCLEWLSTCLTMLYVCCQLLDGAFANQVSHEVDGLIFQPVPDVSTHIISYNIYNLYKLIPHKLKHLYSHFHSYVETFIQPFSLISWNI